MSIKCTQLKVQEPKSNIPRQSNNHYIDIHVPISSQLVEQFKQTGAANSEIWIGFSNAFNDK